MTSSLDIKETVSDNKTGRGRPPVASDKMLQFLHGLYPDVYSRRHLANLYYQTLATSALLAAHNDAFTGRYAWLLSTPDGPQRMKTTVLAELGRLTYNNAIVAWADHLCGEPPRTAREAVSLIRRARLGAGPAPAGGLLQALIRTVNDYCRHYPSLSTTDVLEDIGMLTVLVRENDHNTGEPQ